MPILSNVTHEPKHKIQRRKHAVMQQTKLFPIQCYFSYELQVRSHTCVTTLTSKRSRSSGTVVIQVTIIVGAEKSDGGGRSVRPFATTAAGGNECGGLGDDQDITLSHDARSLEKRLMYI